MKFVKRTINNVNICIDINEGNKVLFEKDYVQSKLIDLQKVGTRDILNLLSENSNFIPLHLKWEITDKCNLSCPFCYIHSDSKVVSDTEFEKNIPLLDYLVENGLLFVVLTGGECTLHKDFARIYIYLKEKGVLVEVYTNGINCNDDIFSLYHQYKPYRVEISLYNDEFDSIVYKNIMKLKQMKINVVAKCTVNTTTYCYFYKIKEWCELNHIPFYFSTDIFNAYDGTKMNKYILDEKKKKEIDILKYKGIKKTNDDKKCFNCGAGKYSIFMNSTELKPCPRIEYGVSIYKNSPTEALNKLENYILFNKGKEINGCYGCEASFLCKMCIAKANDDGNGKYYVPYNYCKSVQEYYIKIKDKI